MSVSRLVLISARIAGAILIAVAAPALAAADDGGASQTPPSATPDGNPWND